MPRCEEAWRAESRRVLVAARTCVWGPEKREPEATVLLYLGLRPAGYLLRLSRTHAGVRCPMPSDGVATLGRGSMSAVLLQLDSQGEAVRMRSKSRVHVDEPIESVVDDIVVGTAPLHVRRDVHVPVQAILDTDGCLLGVRSDRRWHVAVATHDFVDNSRLLATFDLEVSDLPTDHAPQLLVRGIRTHDLAVVDSAEPLQPACEVHGIADAAKLHLCVAADVATQDFPSVDADAELQ
mmetsp:Transcript_29777/g.70211  ORF Transcript_29777/g.70211 Transcript_29777/m.70211 type:complete len:237 (-) Transcript_29777:1384-2094(-)